MKLAKMSLAAATLLGANLYAIDNVKVNGDVKVYYGTADTSVKNGTNTPDMFDKDASYADTALHLGLTADLSEGVSAGISATAVSTLGLENNIVSGTWSSAHKATTNTGASSGSTANLQADDAMWIDEAWIAGTAGKTTAKIGRQALDTPLVFTETWGIDTNTFEAAVLLNQDIEDTTLVAAWIGKSNGTRGVPGGSVSVPGHPLYSAGYVTGDGKFNTFHAKGAYAAGIINNSWKPLNLQAWYFEAPSVVNGVWVQADLDIEGILAGAQFTQLDADAFASGAKKDKAYAAMLGYALKDVVTVKVAYSSVDDEGTLGVGNLATGDDTNPATSTLTNQSKLYTEMWWNYGAVSSTGTDTVAISAETTVAEIDLFAAYYTADIDPKNIATGDLDGVDEIALTASKSFGPLDTSLALIYDDFSYKNGATTGDTEDSTTVQVYLTYNF